MWEPHKCGPLGSLFGTTGEVGSSPNSPQCGFTSHLTCARSSCTRRTPLRIMHAQIGGLYRRYSAPVRIRVKWAYRRYASHGRTCGHILKGVYEVNHLTYLHVNLAQVCLWKTRGTCEAWPMAERSEPCRPGRYSVLYRPACWLIGHDQRWPYGWA